MKNKYLREKIDKEEISTIDKRAKNKKKVILGVSILTLLGIISSIILQNPEWLSPKIGIKDTTISGKSEPEFYFYPPALELDVTQDEVYMELDRDVYYKNGGETFSLADEDPNNRTVILDFFCQYFDTIKAGDAVLYNTYFTENFNKTNAQYTEFTPQMIYDILIEKLSEEVGNNGEIWYTFDVSYKIHRNDGTFRRDIGSDASRRLPFKLIESNGVVRIDHIGQYVYG